MLKKLDLDHHIPSSLSAAQIPKQKMPGREVEITRHGRLPKIAFIISGSLDSLTGGYIYDKKIVDHLRASRAWRVDVISLPYSKRWLDLLLNFWILLRFVGRHYDLVIEDGMVYRSVALANYLFLQTRKIPLVAIVHMVDWPVCKSDITRRIAKKLERMMLESSSRIVVNSKSTYFQIQMLSRKAAGRALLIYPGYEDFLGKRSDGLVADRSRREASQPVQILFAGQLIARKGLHLLLFALSEMYTRKNWTLTVAGDANCDPSYTKQVVNQIKTNRQEDRVSLLGEVDRAQMARLLLNSDIFVLPTMYEAFGLSILEAQTAGLPAVAFDVGGVNEIITDGVTGFLVPPFDTGELARCLETLIENPALRKSFSESAIRLKTKDFSDWEETCEKFAGCIDQILSLKDAKFD